VEPKGSDTGSGIQGLHQTELRNANYTTSDFCAASLSKLQLSPRPASW